DPSEGIGKGARLCRPAGTSIVCMDDRTCTSEIAPSNGPAVVGVGKTQATEGIGSWTCNRRPGHTAISGTKDNPRIPDRHHDVGSHELDLREIVERLAGCRRV